MSSHIALRNKNWINRALISFHQNNSHNTRIEILSEEILDIIKKDLDIENEIKILDFGCGDMSIASRINKLLPNITFIGTDKYDLLTEDNFPHEYVKYDGNRLNFENDYFDVVVLIDVLHHVSDAYKNNVISECSRLGKIVIVKDHFERGFFSRFVLLMDFVGNWAYGVELPRKYFTRNSFNLFCDKNHLKYQIKKSEISLYNHLSRIIRIISPPKLHFIAVLKKE